MYPIPLSTPHNPMGAIEYPAFAAHNSASAVTIGQRCAVADDRSRKPGRPYTEPANIPTIPKPITASWNERAGNSQLAETSMYPKAHPESNRSGFVLLLARLTDFIKRNMLTKGHPKTTKRPEAAPSPNGHISCLCSYNGGLSAFFLWQRPQWNDPFELWVELRVLTHDFT